MLHQELNDQRTIMLKLFLNMSPHWDEGDDPALQVGINGLIEFVILFATFVADLFTGFMKAAVGVVVVDPHGPFFKLWRFSFNFVDGFLSASLGDTAAAAGTILSGSDVLVPCVVGTTTIW
jgi:hypothetical protein